MEVLQSQRQVMLKRAVIGLVGLAAVFAVLSATYERNPGAMFFYVILVAPGLAPAVFMTGNPHPPQGAMMMAAFPLDYILLMLIMRGWHGRSPTDGGRV